MALKQFLNKWESLQQELIESQSNNDNDNKAGIN
jgi:hypothetical protein